MKAYQDLACTIPAVNDGDPVAVWISEHQFVLSQPDPARRPVLRDGRPSFSPGTSLYDDLPPTPDFASRYVIRDGKLVDVLAAETDLPPSPDHVVG